MPGPSRGIPYRFVCASALGGSEPSLLQTVQGDGLGMERETSSWSVSAVVGAVDFCALVCRPTPLSVSGKARLKRLFKGCQFCGPAATRDSVRVLLTGPFGPGCRSPAPLCLAPPRGWCPGGAPHPAGPYLAVQRPPRDRATSAEFCRRPAGGTGPCGAPNIPHISARTGASDG